MRGLPIERRFLLAVSCPAAVGPSRRKKNIFVPPSPSTVLEGQAVYRPAVPLHAASLGASVHDGGSASHALLCHVERGRPVEKAAADAHLEGAGRQRHWGVGHGGQLRPGGVDGQGHGCMDRRAWGCAALQHQLAARQGAVDRVQTGRVGGGRLYVGLRVRAATVLHARPARRAVGPRRARRENIRQPARVAQGLQGPPTQQRDFFPLDVGRLVMELLPVAPEPLPPGAAAPLPLLWPDPDGHGGPRGNPAPRHSP
eukprot:jgi/Mesvir1/20016/Mv13269-RA.1